MKRFSFLLVLTFLAYLALPGCIREYSSDEGKRPILINEVDTLPKDYVFQSGYCTGSSLGIPIVDTVHYNPDSTSILPDSLFLEMPLPGDQGNQNSCSSWATVYAAGSYYIKLTQNKPYSDTGNLSPKFIYNQITKGQCNCTSLPDNLYLLKNMGASSMRTMPFDDKECALQPDSLQKVNAANYKINGWAKVDFTELQTVKRAIMDKKPVLFAIGVDEGFKFLSAPYIWKNSTGTGQPHAMVICGYDDKRKAFRIMNSWSRGWADKGFAWIDYDFFASKVIGNGYVII